MSIDDVVRAVAESALSDEERLGFLDLCEGRAAHELLDDRDRVLSHVRVFETAVANGAMLEDVRAQRIGTALLALLDDAERYSFLERRVLAGAVEYFIQTRDTDADYASSHGLGDDARVVVAVCEALGRPDLAAPLSPGNTLVDLPETD